MHRVTFFIVVIIGRIGLFGGSPVAVGQDDLEGPRGLGMLNVEDVSTDVMQRARTALTGPDGVGKDGPLASVGVELAVLYHQHRSAGARGVVAIREATGPSPKAGEEDQFRERSRIHSPLSADGEFVTVEAVATEDPSRLLRELRDLGLEGGATAGNVVSGRLPISSIEEAASLSSLREMMPSYARTHVGSAESEADSAHWAGEARRNFGVDGSGQKVCVLSDSYDQNGSALTSASDDVQSGDLPGPGNPEGRTTPVDVVEEGGSDGSDEGRAMLQLIHDIAPGATLGFHTALGGLAAFSSGIEDLANADCTVLVDDIRYNTEPFYQDGPVSNAVDDVVTNDGVPYFSSAGNNGNDSYEASFRPSDEPSVINSGWVPHDFDPSAGTDTRQAITIQPGGTFQIFSFQWTDPSAQTGGAAPDTDIDIALVDESGSVVDSSISSNAAVPVESMEYTNEGNSEVTLDLVVEKAPADPVPDSIKYVYTVSNNVTGESDVVIEEYDTGGATVYGHPMAEGAMAVAAAPFFSTARYRDDIDSSAFLEDFSSKGGLTILFDQNGDRLSSPVVRQKPEVTGTDLVDNTFLGSDIPDDAIGGLDPDDNPNFPGTSAAAPNIAAIAALIRQARSGLSPSEVYDRLESTAEDVQVRRTIENGELGLEQIASGVDPWSGHGFVRADRAVPEPAGVQIADAGVSASATGNRTLEISWKQVGTESVDEFLLERRFFGGSFVEEARIDAGATTEFARTLEDLPVGRHTFRISGIRNDSTLVRTTTSGVLRTGEVNVSVYPNPFSESARLSVTLPEARQEAQRVTVRVFDILGRHVATPVRARSITDSESISFRSGEVRSLGSGVYFFRVRGEDFVATTRAVRVR